MTQIACFRRALMRFALMLGVFLSPAISASAGDEDLDRVSSLNLLPGWMREDGLYIAAIRIDLAPGWKTYWRAPGEGGIPPLFDWSGSGNLAQVGYFWPSPRIIDHEDVRTIGFEEHLVLPVLLRPDDPSQPMDLRLSASYGVCEDICVPASGQSALRTAPGAKMNEALISGALATRATPAGELGLVEASCSLRPSGMDYVLRATFRFEPALPAHRVALIETGTDMIWATEADQIRDGAALILESDLYYFGEGAMSLDRSGLRFTLLNDGESVEIRGCGPS